MRLKNFIIKFDEMKPMKYIHSEHSLIKMENHSEEFAIDIVYNGNYMVNFYGILFSCLLLR